MSARTFPGSSPSCFRAVFWSIFLISIDAGAGDIQKCKLVDRGDGSFECATKDSTLGAFGSLSLVANSSDYSSKVGEHFFLELLVSGSTDAEVAATVAVGDSFNGVHSMKSGFKMNLLCMANLVPMERRPSASGSAIVATAQFMRSSSARLELLLWHMNLTSPGKSVELSSSQIKNVGRPSLALFDVHEGMVQDGEVRLRFNNSANDSSAARAFVFPIEHNQCWKGTATHAGCVNPATLASCLQSFDGQVEEPCAMGDAVKAVRTEDGQQYSAVIQMISAGKITVTWDDGETTHRVVDADKVLKSGVACSEKQERPISLTIGTTGIVILSPWSRPALAPGTWAVLLQPHEDTQPQNSTSLTVTLETEYTGQRRPLVLVVLILLVMPILVVGFLLVLNLTIQTCIRARLSQQPVREFQQPGENNRLYPWRVTRQCLCLDQDFRRFVNEKRKALFKGETYFGMIIIGSGAFFTAALQASGYFFEEYILRGDRDVCFYNFECYVPFYFDFPVNNLISHIPYFACGGFTLFLVLRTDFGVEKIAAARNLPPLNLRIFYALGASLFMEAFGSICYHICPKQVQFQFDTAMMFVIGLLSTMALLDVDEKATDAIPPMSLMLGLVVPMWLVSSVGSWFDYIFLNVSWAYIVYCIAVMAWVLMMLCKVERLFPNQQRVGCTLLWLLRAAIGSISIIMLIGRHGRKEAGGMSNMLLLLSIVTMVIITFRQMFRHDISVGARQCSWGIIQVPKRFLFLVMKFGFFAVFLLVSYMALTFFNMKVNDINESPAKSREKNEGCDWFGTLDKHDIWHVLSAIALALWILVLMEMRLRIWKRKMPERSGELQYTASWTGHHADSRDSSLLQSQDLNAATMPLTIVRHHTDSLDSSLWKPQELNAATKPLAVAQPV